MSRIYKTSMGQSIDMDALKLANENTTAIGNMRVNARGDILGAGKSVAVPRNQIMDQVYAVEPGYSPNDPAMYAEREAMIQASNAKELNDLANNLIVTNIEKKPEVAPVARGSLAGSVAKQTTVTQEPIPDPRNPKSNGPTRI
ncbi:hypothetical protein UFOVP190_376 [uncultured Caudovirales phage]|uniref:Uncharacterized protein n=1 Tax=uncultured Caudovirales phage TaxID=2100421 RepID=A0A6J7WHZ3_9CAUD|nr:hypothetical protein UFOVP190_376 [uncultured Caudovirales phage]